MYSGGTDSLCAAALVAKEHSTVHLLTFVDQATFQEEYFYKNIESLSHAYPEVKFISVRMDHSSLAKDLAYKNYLKNIFRHKLMVLATPAYASMSWHILTLGYCVQHGIEKVFDGSVKLKFKAWYAGLLDRRRWEEQH